MSQKFSTFVYMINNKSNIEMQLATYKSMLTKASNDLAKSKQLVGLLKQQIEQGDTELSEELDKANERISMLSEDLSDANARIYVLEVALTQAESDNSELRAEVSRLHSKADDYEKANALLDIADKAQVDYKTIIEVLLHRKFAHNSDMTNLLNGVLDTSDAEVNELGLDGLKKKISDAADEALDEKHKDEESKASSAPEQPAVKLPKKTEKEKQESDSQLPRKRYTTTARVLKSFGIDKSDLPENAKVIICNTPEAKMFAELIPNIDKAYRYLRNNVGSEKVGLDYFDEKRKDILYFMEKINDFVQNIADEKELKNINKIMIEKR